MLFYFVFLPQIFKSKHVHNFVNNIVNKNFGLTFIVENAELETKLKPEIEIEIVPSSFLCAFDFMARIILLGVNSKSRGSD